MKYSDTSYETKRLRIRPLKVEDYLAWLSGCNNRLPSQHRHDEGNRDMSECSMEWYVSLIQKHQELAMNDNVYAYGLFLKADGSHVGMIDFMTLVRSEFQWGCIGYTIHNQYWRNGYGKEAVLKALDIASSDLNFHRIEAHINVDNEASIRLAQSAGLEYECTRKGFIFEFGEWTDNLIYYKNLI